MNFATSRPRATGRRCTGRVDRSVKRQSLSHSSVRVALHRRSIEGIGADLAQAIPYQTAFDGRGLPDERVQATQCDDDEDEYTQQDWAHARQKGSPDPGDDDQTEPGDAHRKVKLQDPVSRTVG